ncbi:MAG: DUF357 domain-containing protein [Candidatus Bathyarchaeia archaeon]
MNSVSIEERAKRYMVKTEKALKNIRILGESILINEERVVGVIEEAKRYLKDAKYYFDRKEYEVSLASISYCEGLLDALRMLKLAEFEW